MKPTSVTNEQIELYIKHLLTPEEQKAFEIMLNEDEDLCKRVRLIRHIMIAYQRKSEEGALAALSALSSEKDLKAIMASAEAQWQEATHPDETAKPEMRTKKIRSYNIAFMWAVAAAVVAMLFYIGWQPRYTSEQLYAAYYVEQPYDVYPTRGDGNELDVFQQSTLKQAVELYEQAQYAEALTLFDLLFADLPIGKISDEVIYYSALSALESNNIEVAIKRLTILSDSADSEYQDDAVWFLALAYLKDNNREKTLEILTKITKTENPHSMKALELKEKLDERKWF